MSDPHLSSCETSVADEVATLRILPPSLWEERAGVTREMRPGLDRWWEVHADLARALNEVRHREDVRVIVLTGAQEGTFGYNPTDPRDRHVFSDEIGGVRFPYSVGWQVRNFQGVIQHHETSALCEKPIIARVTGNAFGGGLNMMLACDMIVAREDAIMLDYHMGLDQRPWPGAPDISGFANWGVEGPNGIVPGDGGIAWIPQYLSPARAKEFLMLGRPYTAREFERLGVINYAVPLAEVDLIVDDLVKRVISRSPEHIAMTKRLTNKSVMHHLNMTLDAAAYAEWLGLPSRSGQGERWTEARYNNPIAPDADH